jgi:hypothetical protein
MSERQDTSAPMTPEVAVMVLNSPGASERMIAEAVAALAGLVESAMPEGPYRDAVGADGQPKCWHFVGYRADSPKGNRDNPPGSAQYQGVIFADGTVTMRWLTATRSWSVWDTFADMFDAHGRPEYGTEIHWPNGAPQEARNVIEAAAQAHRERVAAEAGIVRTDSGEHYDPTQDNTPPSELPGAVASSPDGWTVGSLGEMTEEQAAEILNSPGAQRWTGTHFEPARPPQDGER